jgi:hypothetical protein
VKTAAAGKILCMDPHEVAALIASRFGLVVEDPVVLHDSNNTVIWLRPEAIVAKVATGHHHRLGLEMSVARHLVACGAPVAAPADALPPVAHQVGGLEATFWTYVPQANGQEPEALEWASALYAVHQALEAYPGVLPSFDHELDSVAGVLSDPDQALKLTLSDRTMLLSALSVLRSELAVLEPPRRALHGSPHSGNVLVVEGKVVVVDFETACQGPVEWDLAHLGDAAVRAYPGRYDTTALTICRGLVSVKTAAWCWAKYEHKELRWHARHHLAQVRRLMATGTI